MELMKTISCIWSFLHVLLLVSLLFEFRCSQKKVNVITVFAMTVLFLLNLVIYRMFEPVWTTRILLLTCLVPGLIMLYILAKQRDGRFFFTFCMASTGAYGITVILVLLDHYLMGGSYVMLLVSHLIVFPVVEFVIWKRLRRPYLELQRTVQKGWGSFACKGVVFYALLVVHSSVPASITTRPEDGLAMTLMLLVMPMMYYDVFRLLVRQQKLLRAEEESRILRVQSSMLSLRAEQLKEMEEQMRISRHDLRHWLLTAAGLVQSMQTEEAVEFLTKAEQSLDQYRVERWSADPVLDAVFSVYFRKAKAAGVRVEADVSFSDTLPVDAAELSTVFANALENAVEACGKLPEGQRWIRCKCLSQPQFMFQITNPYTGNVIFDNAGRPVSDQPGHGIGTRSIAAFCEKHGAHCEYKAADGVFTMRMLIY